MMKDDWRGSFMMMTDEWLTIIEHAEDLTEILLSSEAVVNYRKAHDDVYSDTELGKIHKRVHGNEGTL